MGVTVRTSFKKITKYILLKQVEYTGITKQNCKCYETHHLTEECYILSSLIDSNSVSFPLSHGVSYCVWLCPLFPAPNLRQMA